MPKMKSKRSAAKRFKVTGSGKIMRQRQFSGCHHILEKKSAKRKRKFKQKVEVTGADRNRLSKLVPYLKRAR